MKKFAALLVIFFCFAAVCAVQAQTSITLAWDASASEPLDKGEGGGYRLYEGKQSRTYNPTPAAVVAEGPNTVTIDTTVFRGRHYFAVTAFYMEGGELFESGYSNEVSHPFKPEPPSNLKKIENVALYPAKKIGGFFAGLIGRDRDLQIEDAGW